MALYENIERLCKERGIKISEMCRGSGASRGSLTDLKKGRIENLHSTTLAKNEAMIRKALCWYQNGNLALEYCGFL